MKWLAINAVSISISDVKHTSMTGINRSERLSETKCRVSGIDDVGSAWWDPNEEIWPLLDKL